MGQASVSHQELLLELFSASFAVIRNYGLIRCDLFQQEKGHVQSHPRDVDTVLD
jgi:hypothetical protein